LNKPDLEETMVKELKNILYNHQKLLSMISDKVLPIKNSLLEDCHEMSKILETATHKHKKEEEKQ